MCLETFNGGYTKALLDVLHWFEQHDDDLKYERCYNSKCVRSILGALVNHRQEMRETGTCCLTMDRKTKEFK